MVYIKIIKSQTEYIDNASSSVYTPSAHDILQRNISVNGQIELRVRNPLLGPECSTVHTVLIVLSSASRLRKSGNILVKSIVIRNILCAMQAMMLHSGVHPCRKGQRPDHGTPTYEYLGKNFISTKFSFVSVFIVAVYIVCWKSCSE